MMCTLMYEIVNSFGEESCTECVVHITIRAVL